jgi:RimJ/RimL family protein N-acetyltransferase
MTTSVRLHRIGLDAAQAVTAGQLPDGLAVAEDYPTEFSSGIAGAVTNGSPLGPYFIHRAKDDVIVGEIGGGLTSRDTAEIGYAVVASCRGQGYATDAVLALVVLARDVPVINRLIAHTPLDRPASARVLHKAGFSLLGDVDDEHQGQHIRVQRWELQTSSAA